MDSVALYSHAELAARASRAAREAAQYRAAAAESQPRPPPSDRKHAVLISPELTRNIPGAAAVLGQLHAARLGKPSLAWAEQGGRRTKRHKRLQDAVVALRRGEIPRPRRTLLSGAMSQALSSRAAALSLAAALAPSAPEATWLAWREQTTRCGHRSTDSLPAMAGPMCTCCAQRGPVLLPQPRPPWCTIAVFVCCLAMSVVSFALPYETSLRLWPAAAQSFGIALGPNCTQAAALAWTSVRSANLSMALAVSTASATRTFSAEAAAVLTAAWGASTDSDAKADSCRHIFRAEAWQTDLRLAMLAPTSDAVLSSIKNRWTSDAQNALSLGDSVPAAPALAAVWLSTDATRTSAAASSAQAQADASRAALYSTATPTPVQSTTARLGYQLAQDCCLVDQMPILAPYEWNPLLGPGFGRLLAAGLRSAWHTWRLGQGWRLLASAVLPVGLVDLLLLVATSWWIGAGLEAGLGHLSWGMLCAFCCTLGACVSMALSQAVVTSSMLCIPAIHIGIASVLWAVRWQSWQYNVMLRLTLALALCSAVLVYCLLAPGTDAVAALVAGIVAAALTGADMYAMELYMSSPAGRRAAASRRRAEVRQLRAELLYCWGSAAISRAKLGAVLPMADKAPPPTAAVDPAALAGNSAGTPAVAVEVGLPGHVVDLAAPGDVSLLPNTANAAAAELIADAGHQPGLSDSLPHLDMSITVDAASTRSSRWSPRPLDSPADDECSPAGHASALSTCSQCDAQAAFLASAGQRSVARRYSQPGERSESAAGDASLLQHQQSEFAKRPCSTCSQTSGSDRPPSPQGGYAVPAGGARSASAGVAQVSGGESSELAAQDSSSLPAERDSSASDMPAQAGSPASSHKPHTVVVSQPSTEVPTPASSCTDQDEAAAAAPKLARPLVASMSCDSSDSELEHTRTVKFCDTITHAVQDQATPRSRSSSAESVDSLELFSTAARAAVVGDVIAADDPVLRVLTGVHGAVDDLRAAARRRADGGAAEVNSDLFIENTDLAWSVVPVAAHDSGDSHASAPDHAADVSGTPAPPEHTTPKSPARRRRAVAAGPAEPPQTTQDLFRIDGFSSILGLLKERWQESPAVAGVAFGSRCGWWCVHVLWGACAVGAIVALIAALASPAEHEFCTACQYFACAPLRNYFMSPMQTETEEDVVPILWQCQHIWWTGRP